MDIMTHVYRIRNFTDYFETSESRKRSGPMEWVKMRTKHDGRGFRRVTRLQHSVHALLGWYLILQVAAKMPVRGLLADLDGPLDADDLADKTLIPKKAFQSALTSLCDEEIGWLEKLEWDPEASFSDNLARLGIKTAHNGRERHATARDGTQRHATARGGTNETAEKEESSLGRPARDGTERHATARDGTQRHATARNGTERGTEITESTEIRVPLPSPKGDSAPEPSADDLIRDADKAKQIICAQILNGKNAARPWSYEATNNLARLLPLPRSDIETIARFRAIPKDEAVPELKYRRDPITETPLMQFWGDELLRAQTYLQKAASRPEKKKEPELWPELFVWLNGNPELVVPDSFWKLGRDQQQEYHDNIEAYRDSLKPKPTEVL